MEPLLHDDPEKGAWATDRAGCGETQLFEVGWVPTHDLSDVENVLKFGRGMMKLATQDGR